MISFGLRALVVPMTAALMIAVVLHATATPQTPQPASPPTYKDPAASVEARVADLLGRMTIEEKIAQLVTVWIQRSAIQDAEGRFTSAKAQALLGQGIGQVARPSEIAGGPKGPRVRGPRAHAEFVNAVQR